MGFAEALASNPARKIRSAIDLESWIGELSHRDRYIMAARMAGYSPTSASPGTWRRWGCATAAGTTCAGP